jgi:hypothetical protein
LRADAGIRRELLARSPGIVVAQRAGMKSFGFFVLLMACHVSTPVQSSRSVLGRELSEVVVSVEAQAAALDVVDQFAKRGFMLKDQSRDGRGITMRIAGDRRTVSEALHPVLDSLGDAKAAIDGRTNDRDHGVVEVTYGSAFHVRVEPLTDGTSHIKIVGRTVRRGIELCTEDSDVAGPCDPKQGMAFEPPGEKEAELIEEVFAELRLRGIVIAPARPLTIAERGEYRKCLQRRRDQVALANRVSSSEARASILGAAPRCE